MLHRMSSTAQLMTITPEIAKGWLSRNQSNRRVKNVRVLELSTSMAAGRWRVNGETIKISEGGTLIDGQHRLLGCVKSGVSFDSFVITGLPNEIFDTIDIGVTRTGGDVLGIVKTHNAAATSAAIKWVYIIRANVPCNTYRMPPYAVLEALRAEPGIEASVSRGLVARSLIAPGLAGALHYLFSEKDPEAADAFFKDVGHGVGLERGDAVLLLRERLMRERMQRTQLKRDEICALCIKAWQKRRQQNSKTFVLRGTIKNKGEAQWPEII